MLCGDSCQQLDLMLRTSEHGHTQLVQQQTLQVQGWELLTRHLSAACQVDGCLLEVWTPVNLDCLHFASIGTGSTIRQHSYAACAALKIRQWTVDGIEPHLCQVPNGYATVEMSARVSLVMCHSALYLRVVFDMTSGSACGVVDTGK